MVFKQTLLDDFSSYHVTAVISLLNSARKLATARRDQLVLNLHFDYPWVHENFL